MRSHLPTADKLYAYTWATSQLRPAPSLKSNVPSRSLVKNGVFSINDLLLLSKSDIKSMKPPISLGAARCPTLRPAPPWRSSHQHGT